MLTVIMSISTLTNRGALRINSWRIDRLRKKHPLRYLFWEATLNCNFNCQHCGSRAGRGCLHQGELTTREIKGVFQSIADKVDPKNIMVAVTGGEPLLRQDLFEVMALAHQLGFNWGLVTNGWLVDKNMVKKMKEAGMATIVVSIDGLGEKHDDLRQTEGSFDRAMSAVRLLTDPKTFQNVQITTTVNRKNINDLENMWKEFSNLKIDSWRAMNIDPIGRAQDNLKLLLKPEEHKRLIEFVAKKRKTSGFEVTYGCSGFLGPKWEGKTRDWSFYCSTGITTGSILHNGDIFVCPNVPRLENLVQGNVRKDDFMEVWEKKFEVFRDENRTSCLKCRKCEFWTECRGGPFHLWDFEAKEPKFCHYEFLKN